jgi:hypothetical protein
MVDEALKHETASVWHGSPGEARSEEFREQEGPGDGEPTPDGIIHTDVEIPGVEMSLDDINGRAELARYLEHHIFPARPSELAANARGRHAPDSVIEMLEQAPDRVYETVSQLWVGLGGRAETPRDHS